MSHPASCIRSGCSSEADEGGGDAERSGRALGAVGACLGTNPGPHFGLPFSRLSARPILTLGPETTQRAPSWKSGPEPSVAGCGQAEQAHWADLREKLLRKAHCWSHELASCCSGWKV